MFFAYSVPPLFLLLILLSATLVAAEGGLLLGRWISRRYGASDSILFGVVVGGVLGLVGLILGFSFSLAIGRFDHRESLVVAEANAAGTAYLRASFLPPAQREPFKIALRGYLAARIELYDVYRFQDRRIVLLAQSNRYRDRMWGIITTDVNRTPQLPLMQLAATTNDLIDAGGEEEAWLNNRLPRELSLMLLVVVLSAAALLGYGFGLNNTTRRIMTVLFCVLVSVVVFMIFDLDRPQVGFVRVSLAPLQSTLDSMH